MGKTPRGLEGDALDGQGFIGALAQHGYGVQNMAVLIIGCGGAGASSAWDALLAGASRVGLFDSDPVRQQALAGVLRQRFGAQRVQVLPSPAGDWPCVLNASPLGMRVDDPLPMALKDVTPGAVLVDATTPAQPSRWLLQAQQSGHPVIDGADFTHGQVLAMARFFALSDAVQAALAWEVSHADTYQGSPARLSPATDWHALLAEHRARAAFDSTRRCRDTLHNVWRTALATFVPQSVVRDAARAALVLVLLMTALGQV